MSYITATKELLGDDLRKLICHVTHLKSGTPEYKQLEDFAWRQIFQKYHTSVTDDNVKNCIDGFAEKFIFHGFAQKAENLRLLIRHYSNLDYFKNKTDGTLKWGFILLLIRLSHRPTDCDEDDDPIDIRALLKPENEEEPISDWPAYLKEGWEKFRLPSDDESVVFSDDEAPRNDFDLNEIPIFRENAHRLEIPTSRNTGPSHPHLTIAEYDELCQESINEFHNWAESHYHTAWWKVPDYSEQPSAQSLSKHYCYLWKAQQKDRAQLEGMRVMREAKIITELLYLLGTVNGSSSYIFEFQDGSYTLKNNLTIPSLSPPLFRSVMESHFSKYLPHIACMIQFTEKVSQLPVLDSSVSDTYLAYSKAVSDILNDFRIELSQAELVWSKRERTMTLRTLHSRLQPWFECFCFLANVHSKAVYPDFTKVETWQCSLRLLSVMLNEMKWISNSRFKKLALGLFLNSVRIYLRIIAKMMKGMKNADPKKEFLIYESREDQVLQIRRYSTILMENNIPIDEFWGPFISSCHRAISSTHFIMQLNKRSTFSKKGTDTNVLILDVIEELKTCISRVAGISEIQEAEAANGPCGKTCKTRFKDPVYNSRPKTTGSHLIRTMFRESLKPKTSFISQDTPVDKFMKSLKESELSTYPVNFFITKIFVSVIQKYMEPVGFAYDTLINEFKLLEHLRCLRRVFFIQILEPFVMILFREIVNKSLMPLDWTCSLRNSISDYYGSKTAQQYRCTVAQVSLIGPSHPKFVHESLSFTKLYYEPEAHLKVLIPVSCIKAYNEIFKFLLQVKWAFHIITSKFTLRGVVETPDNFSIFRRMYLLRMRLLNTMTAFRNYFFSMDESGFEAQIKDLCVKARDLQTIARAHKDFLVKCKLHCFLNRKNECKLLVDALLVMCFKCVKLWECREELTAPDVGLLEEEYYRVSTNLVSALHKRESDYSGSLRSHYSLLQNDLTTYLPPAPVPRSASAELSSVHNFSTFSHFNQSVRFASSGFKDA